jgi:hypothetical protein
MGLHPSVEDERNDQVPQDLTFPSDPLAVRFELDLMKEDGEDIIIDTPLAPVRVDIIPIGNGFHLIFMAEPRHVSCSSFLMCIRLINLDESAPASPSSMADPRRPFVLCLSEDDLERFAREGRVCVSLSFQEGQFRHPSPDESLQVGAIFPFPVFDFMGECPHHRDQLISRPEMTQSQALPSPPPNREQFGMVGLRNTDGCCFLNCVLQLLFHCVAFRQHVIAVDPAPGGPLAVLQSLFVEMADSPDDCCPDALIRALGDCLSWSDAGDAFLALVALVSDFRLFDAPFRTIVSWDGGSRDTFDPPSPVVAVTAHEFHSLRECVGELGAPAFLENYLIDPATDLKARVKLTREFAEIPGVLVLQLLRFRRGGVFAGQRIEPDEPLELQFATGPVEYRLRAVIAHRNFHYIALVKRAAEWFEISDDCITKTSVTAVKARGAADGMLFAYAKADTEAAVFGDTD